MSILIHCDSFLENMILFLKYLSYYTLNFTSYNNYQCWKVSGDYSLESLAQNVHCGSLLSHKNESYSCYIHHWRHRSLPHDHMTQGNTSLHNSHPLNPTDLPSIQNLLNTVHKKFNSAPPCYNCYFHRPDFPHNHYHSCNHRPLIKQKAMYVVLFLF